MISLNLQEPTEEQLMQALKDATQARNLLENNDFQWLTDKLEEETKLNREKLAHDEEPAVFYKRQGRVFAIELFLKKLRFKASQVEVLEERLAEYGRSDEPVARGA